MGTLFKMKVIIEIGHLLMPAALRTGCATPYMHDRKHDAANLFTCTIDKRVGDMKARVSPFGLEFLDNQDCLLLLRHFAA
jgi:hypothetical protein